MGAAPARWTVAAGTWTVAEIGSHVASQTDPTTSVVEELRVGSAGWTDYTVSAQVRDPGTGNPIGIACREQDVNDQYQLILKLSNLWYLGKKVAGFWTTLATGTFAHGAGTWYTFSLSCIGTTISSAVDTSFSGGQVALRTVGPAEFDNVTVSLPAAPPATAASTAGATGTAPPTSTATSTATATLPPAEGLYVAAGTIVATDTFSRTAVAGGWGTASDGNLWTLRNGDSGQLGVSGDEGRMNSTSATTYLTLGSAAPAEAEAEVHVTLAQSWSDDGRLILRWSGSNTDYVGGFASPNGSGELGIYKASGGSAVKLADGGMTAVNDQGYWLRFRVQTVGSTAVLSLKAWADTDAEPVAWNVTTTDPSPLPAGQVGIGGYAGTSSGWTVDHFSAGSLDAPLATATDTATASETETATATSSATPTSTATATPTTAPVPPTTTPTNPATNPTTSTSTPLPPTSTPPTPASLGLAGPVGSADGGDNDNISSSPITSGPNGAIVTTLSAYIDPPNPGDQIAMGIYANGPGNLPGTLVTHSAKTTVSAGGWNTVSISPTTLAPNTIYWLAYNSSSGADNLHYTSDGSGLATYSSAVTFGTWPTTVPGAAGNLATPGFLLTAGVGGTPIPGPTATSSPAPPAPAVSCLFASAPRPGGELPIRHRQSAAVRGLLRFLRRPSRERWPHRRSRSGPVVGGADRGRRLRLRRQPGPGRL
ncbi:MAG TPA: hypothetical protein VMW49_04755 [Candidatus Dormibacteraeota bacterium]|nr:hypothetical protein [Candidatus Dormibacteraeota bacterium]